MNLEMVERVKALCAKNPAYETMLREVIKADEIHPDPGFEFKDLQSVQGGHIAAMVTQGIIFKSYESNQYTHFRLAVPHEELESILDDIELTRLESERTNLLCTQAQTQSQLTPALILEFEALVKTEPDLLL